MPLRPAPPVNALPLLQEERAELVALLNSLREGDPETPTDCSAWTVKDVAAHILGGDLSLLSRLRDGYITNLDGGPPDPAQREEFVPWLDGVNQRWVEGSRLLSHQTIKELLVTTGEATYAFLSRLPQDDAGEVVAWAGSEPAPWWLCVGREFTERWIHQQHIRRALARPGLNGPSFVQPLLATLLRSLPLAYADVEAPEGTTVAFSIDGRGGGGWAVRRTGDGWGLFAGRDKEADATVITDQDTAWRYLVRDMPRPEAASAVTIEGDKALGERFFAAVAALVRAG